MLTQLVLGLQRLNNQGLISTLHYDPVAETIGFVHVKIPPILVKQASTQVFTVNEMWQKLSVRQNALAVIRIEPHYLVVVLPGEVRILCHSEHEAALSAKVSLGFHPTIPIGFIRTIPGVKDANIPPYRLYQDTSGRISLDGVSTQYVEGAIPCRDSSLYRSLLQKNARAVYMTQHGPIYL